MKNVKNVLSALLCAVLFSTTVLANEVKSASEKEKASINALRNQIAYTFSDVPIENDLDVYVRFSVSNEKSLVLEEVLCIDKEFAKMVKTKLEKCRMKSLSSLNGPYLIKIRFIKNQAVENVISSNDLLRSLFLEYLSPVSDYYEGSVIIQFAVKDGLLVLGKVEGVNANLVKSVETILTDGKIVVPAGINGKYQVKVSF
jgi:hypothetical protein